MKEIGKCQSRALKSSFNLIQTCLPLASGMEICTNSINMMENNIRQLIYEGKFIKKETSSIKNYTWVLGDSFSIAKNVQIGKTKEPAVIDLDSSPDEVMMQEELVILHQQDSINKYLQLDAEPTATKSIEVSKNDSTLPTFQNQTKSVMNEAKENRKYKKINLQLIQQSQIKQSLAKYLPDRYKMWLDEMSEEETKDIYNDIGEHLKFIQFKELKFCELEKQRKIREQRRKTECLSIKRFKMDIESKKASNVILINSDSENFQQVRIRKEKQKKHSSNRNKLKLNQKPKKISKRKKPNKQKQTTSIITEHDFLYISQSYSSYEEQIYPPIDKSDSLKSRPCIQDTQETELEGNPRKRLHREIKQSMNQVSGSMEQFSNYVHSRQKIKVLVQKYTPMQSNNI